LKVVWVVLLIAAGGTAYYFLVYRPGHPSVQEVAYILPSSADLVDSRAEIHSVVGTLKNGDRVEVLSRDGDWARVRLASGVQGWIATQNLMDSATYEGGRRLLKDLQGIPAQASGHTTYEVNLRLDPSRDAPRLELLARNQDVEIFGRRLVPRASETAGTGKEGPATTESSAASSEPPVQDAWYLVRTGARAGWLYGRLITLDIPDAIAGYAHSINLVAWLVLDHVADNGHDVPQYLVADRIGTQDVDFNHIRVFTWWAAKDRYATAYVESNLNGYFPIRVTQVAGRPYFRLRLVDKQGRKLQKVYQLTGTIVRPVGTVDGWASDAIPIGVAAARGRRRRR
jgi:Bacterial SH3 domain